MHIFPPELMCSCRTKMIVGSLNARPVGQREQVVTGILVSLPISRTAVLVLDASRSVWIHCVSAGDLRWCRRARQVW